MTDHLDPKDPLLAGLFDAATAPAEAPLPGEAAAVAAFRAAYRRPRRSAAFVAVVAMGGAVMVGGVAAAATGSVPLLGGHQGHVSVPPHVVSSHHPTARPSGTSGDPVDQVTTVPTRNGRNGLVSPLAHASTAPGDRGASVCRAASAGHCRATPPDAKPSHAPKPDATRPQAPGRSTVHATPKATHPAVPVRTPQPAKTSHPRAAPGAAD